MINELKQMSKKERLHTLLPALCVALATSFTWFIYAPLSLYFTNIQEFWFDLYDVLPVLGAMFGICLAAYLLVYGILMLIHKNAYYIGVVVGFIVLVASIIQGNFQTGYIPLINGEAIDWGKLGVHRITCIILWVLVTAIVAAIYKLFKFKGFRYVATIISSAFFVLFLIVTIVIGVQEQGFNRKSGLTVTDKDIRNYSSDKNFIIFVVDATDSRQFKYFMDTDITASYRTEFKDFTMYNNMASIFPFTDHSLPTMIGYAPYYCEKDFYEYVGDAYREAPLFELMKSNGYKMDFYETLAPTYEESILQFGNVKDLDREFSSTSDAMRIQLKMIGLRYLPFDLKRFCEFDPTEISANQKIENGDVNVFTTDNRLFLETLNHKPTTNESQPLFKFIHVKGSHAPFTYDEDMNVIPKSEGSYARNTHATVNMVQKYIQYLKANDLYDNSVIIVMADHGYSKSKHQLERSNPLFMVKGIGETHDKITVDEAPVSFADLNTCYERLVKGQDSSTVFDWKEGDDRQREHLVYNSEMNTPENGINHKYTYDVEQDYVLVGHAGDKNNLHATGKMYTRNNFSMTTVFLKINEWLGNYGYTIIFLTILFKLVLTPINIWVHKNSIKMIKMQPEINRVKINYYGDRENTSLEISKIYKKEKYNTWASIIPMVLTIVIMILLYNVITKMAFQKVEMPFMGYNLSWGGAKYGMMVRLVAAALAGLSSLALCVAQNAVNVLQKEQSFMGRYGILLISVGISVYLGFVVPLGVILYWLVSNLYSAIWVLIINNIIRPKDYIDYEALEKTKEELKALENVGGKKSFFDPNRKRENADYKRFFSIKNKHLVFYSESNGFYKYFKGYIDEILEHTDMPIHYITSDPDDKIFEMAKTEPRIKPYYISEKKLIVLMMKMDADVVVMTVPDLENFHIKRSRVRSDVEYILVQHGVGSLNLTMRLNSMDHYDTVFSCGEHQTGEIRALEKNNNLKTKKIVECGYPLIDDMIANFNKTEHPENERKKILIAPSWADGNIVESCLDKILDSIKDEPYDIIVRPHPQHVRYAPALFEGFKAKFKDFKNIEIQTDFSSNNPIMEADILMTDWSGIAWEYSFVTERPVIFVDTKMKAINPEYEKVDIVPMNIALRDVIGRSVKVENTDKMNEVVKDLIDNREKYREIILKTREKSLYNIGTSAYVGGKYIVEAVMSKVEARRNSNEK